ncbi:MAG: murein biosynthesis integral membrane protein MurJ [Candidatus Nomurabacteria bacterium]|jgi:putative peptidoglycan lipid II flippase|nr:murein biosynthesis integral membrane protein MurJ [Candidatus Nomurabacteria bacterium]
MAREKVAKKISRTLARANSAVNIKTAATLLATSTLISGLLGFYRDRLLNSMYLDTYKVGIDAYTVSFTIPDFMYFILVSGALSVTFIPVFNQRFLNGNKESAWQLSSSVLNFLALATFFASILIIIFAPLLVQYVVGPGLDETGQHLATAMMRVIAVNPMIFAVATVLSSMQQAVGRFVFFALSPALYNIGIIFGALVLTNGINIGGWQIFEGGIMGVALGVVLGAILQLIVSSMGLAGLDFKYEFKVFWKNLGFRRVLKLLPARSADQGLDYVSSLVDTNLASRMAEGTVRSYNQAMTLHQMPINLIGIAISTAAFPQMTERISQGRPDLFAKELRTVLRVIIWLALPVAVIFFSARRYIVSVIVKDGNELIASLLAVLSIVILVRSIFYLASRSFYAQQDTKTPLVISFVTIAIAVTCAIVFTQVLGMGAEGLALAQMIWAILEVSILFILMQARIKGLFTVDFWSAVFRMIISAIIVGVLAYVLANLLDLSFDDQTLMTVVPKLLVITIVSLAVYLLLSKIFRLDEVNPVVNFLKRILFGRFKYDK